MQKLLGNSFKCVVAVCITALLSACGNALPGRTLPEDLKGYAVAAQEASVASRESSELAKSQLERSEMLLQEARTILKRVEDAEQRCARIVKKIPRRRTKYLYRAKGAAKTKKEKSVEPPKFSPSDAPESGHLKSSASSSSSSK